MTFSRHRLCKRVERGAAMNRWLFSTALSSATLLALCDPSFANETQAYTYDALGRLVAVQYSGTVNNNQAHSLCYDPAGNRTQYQSSATGALAACAGGAPTPTPTPTPTNQPPTTVNDTGSQAACEIGIYNVLANDTDPEGNYPLSLVSVSGARFSVNSTTELKYNGSTQHGGTATATYTVRDSLGATATGTLTVTIGSGVCL